MAKEAVLLLRVNANCQGGTQKRGERLVFFHARTENGERVHFLRPSA